MKLMLTYSSLTLLGFNGSAICADNTPALSALGEERGRGIQIGIGLSGFTNSGFVVVEERVHVAALFLKIVNILEFKQSVKIRHQICKFAKKFSIRHNDSFLWFSSIYRNHYTTFWADVVEIRRIIRCPLFGQVTVRASCCLYARGHCRIDRPVHDLTQAYFDHEPHGFCQRAVPLVR
jgi:hypothetical protein